MAAIPCAITLTTSAPSSSGALAAIGTDAISSIRLVKNGQTCHEWAPDSLQFTHTWRQERAPKARAHYYLVVTQRNAERAWTSPIFVYEEVP
jgi:hypothetical protein